MIPGPVEVHPEVLAAMSTAVMPHYGAEWLQLYGETLNILKAIFHTHGDAFVMPGSGTVAIDACLGSAFSTGDTILVGTNGFFGDRLTWLAQGYGLKVIPVPARWGESLQPEDFEKAYQQHPDAKGAAVVHLETSTTILNPVGQIGKVIRHHGGIFMVDAVSSLGGVTFDMDGWCIDLCASATQKCLGCLPGLAPVAVGKRGWEAVNRNSNKAHGWYGDLAVWKKYAVEWGDWHPTPVTMPVNNITALNVALHQLMEEGIETRMERYRSLAFRLRNGLRKIGLQPFTPDIIMNPVLTAVSMPDGTTSEDVVNYLANEFHIKISGGLGELKQSMIRIGHMSPVVKDDDIDLVLQALETYFKK
jgi:alanine-glyoxylate transaminase/serine-glyoxylate transaminase/serine-pyruvate transaminase